MPPRIGDLWGTVDGGSAHRMSSDSGRTAAFGGRRARPERHEGPPERLRKGRTPGSPAAPILTRARSARDTTPSAATTTRLAKRRGGMVRLREARLLDVGGHA